MKYFAVKYLFSVWNIFSIWLSQSGLHICEEICSQYFLNRNLCCYGSSQAAVAPVQAAQTRPGCMGGWACALLLFPCRSLGTTGARSGRRAPRPGRSVTAPVTAAVSVAQSVPGWSRSDAEILIRNIFATWNIFAPAPWNIFSLPVWNIFSPQGLSERWRWWRLSLPICPAGGIRWSPARRSPRPPGTTSCRPRPSARPMPSPSTATSRVSPTAGQSGPPSVVEIHERHCDKARDISCLSLSLYSTSPPIPIPITMS